ncbi:hypothetical protein [Streptomyces sp.]|uniref:hypothetical protein n=1 Tax=Streptomyces sp. TaxID=1931 RepID=UPI002D770CDE|nr:hypothetical protein [Streptomyces sp.]HET6356162.1 hypothetical protein [Streptomyces sp.]
MRTVLNRLLAPVIQPFILLATFTIVARTLVLDDDEEEGDYDDTEELRPAPRGLRAYEKEFLQDIESRSRRYNRLARYRLRTAQVLSAVSLTSTAAVPVVIAASLPGWSAAALAAVAGVSQGIQQIRQDHRLGLENHLMAVDLSRACRKYRLAAARSSLSERGSNFDNFVREIEELQANSRPRFLEIVMPRPSTENASSGEAPPQLQQ